MVTRSGAAKQLAISLRCYTHSKIVVLGYQRGDTVAGAPQIKCRRIRAPEQTPPSALDRETLAKLQR